MGSDGSDEVRARAETLAAAADHPSVGVERLAGEAGYIPKSYLADGPAVTHLDTEEAPAYLFSNRKRGVGIGSKRNRTKPDDGYETIVLVTDRRTLALVGQAGGDAVVSVPHERAAAVEYATSLFANRLTVRTPRTAYHFWIDRSVAEPDLDAAAGYVHRRLPETPRAGGGSGSRSTGGPDAGDDGRTDAPEEHRVTYRGKPVAPEAGGTPSPDASGQGSDDPAASAADAEAGDEDATDGADAAVHHPVTYRGKRVD